MPEPLVMFSPLPPARSGIADYMLELLPALAANRPIVVVCENEDAVSGQAWGTITPRQYASQKSLAELPHFYQIGNNADHVFVYRACRKLPGILVQHDFNLHYLVEDATLALGDVQGYREIMTEEYGEPGATLADLRQLGLFSEAQKITLSLNTHLLHGARGIIVHSQWVHDRLPANTRSRSTVIPHHFAPQATQYDSLARAAAREHTGLPPEGFVLLSLGYITPPKQVQTTLAALAILRRGGSEFTYVIGGERNPGFDIDHHIRLHGLEDCVRVTGFLEEADFFNHIIAADALVNLRYPTVGESSGTLARALALGLPAVVHNFGPSNEIPDDVALKVPLELGAPLKLVAALDTMMGNPTLRESLGRRAKSYMRAHCAVENSAQRYLELCDRIYPNPT